MLYVDVGDGDDVVLVYVLVDRQSGDCEQYPFYTVVIANDAQQQTSDYWSYGQRT